MTERKTQHAATLRNCWVFADYRFCIALASSIICRSSPIMFCVRSPIPIDIICIRNRRKLICVHMSSFKNAKSYHWQTVRGATKPCHTSMWKCFTEFDSVSNSIWPDSQKQSFTSFMCHHSMYADDATVCVCVCCFLPLFLRLCSLYRCHTPRIDVCPGTQSTEKKYKAANGWNT